MLLETQKLTKRFGGLVAMDELDIEIEEGCIQGLIGPNGAGKSTFFNLVTGVLPPTSGKVLYDGKDITRSRPHQVAAMGIGRTFQLNPLFGEFTVFDNVATAHHLNPHSSVASVYFNTKQSRENERRAEASTHEILDFLKLSHVKDELAKNLPHGYQKVLGVARALAIKPRLLMLDEPLGGMNPEEIAFSIAAISQLRDRGVTILVVEHNMQVLSILDRVTVISFGAKIFDGTPEEVKRDETVIKTYFGGDAYE
jgi:branched-chain amino acid transport system ATP-binding protein